MLARFTRSWKTLAVLCGTLILLPLHSPHSQTADEINKAADDFIAALKSFEGKDAEIRATLNKTREALNTYDLDANKWQFVITRSNELVGPLKGTTTYQPNVLAAIDALIDAAYDVEDSVVEHAAERRAKALSDLIGKTPTLKHGQAAWVEVLALLKALEDVENNFATTAAERRAEDLIALIDKTDVLKLRKAGWEKLGLLLAKLEEVEAKFPVAAIDRRAPILTSLIKGNLASQIDLRDHSELVTLSKEIRKLQTAKTPLATVATASDELVNLLEGNKAKIPSTPAVLASVQALRAKVNEVAPEQTPPGVHVVSAWFGDLTARGKRCNALHAMRQICERQPSCAIPNTSPVSNSLCGYDPAEYAEARNKGLVMTYACLQREDSVWDDLLSGQSEVHKSLLQSATLRASGQTVICRKPKP